MKTSAYVCVGMVAFVWVGCCPASHAQVTFRQDQSEQRKSAELRPRDSWVRVMRPYVGNPILVIDYPWKIHARPSIEVLFLAEGEPEPLDPRPFSFVDRYLNGDLAMDVYRSQDRGERVAFVMKVRKHAIDFEINGKRNSLSKPAVWVDFHWKRPDLTTETRTCFCLLDSWALDERTLFLDLPTVYYFRPGKLRVWMLSGKDAVWTQTIAWPGMPTPADNPFAEAAAGDGDKAPPKPKP